MRICGKNPQIVETVIIAPEDVERVMCQIMAYCTNEEPKRETVCAVKKRAVLPFQEID